MALDTFQPLDTVDVKGKRVLMRVDLNVPMEGGQILDTTRIDRLVPGLKEMTDKGAKVVLLSHFGRPKGKVDPRFSLHFLRHPLEKAMGNVSVGFAPTCIGSDALQIIEHMASGQITLLENLRFFKEEEQNDESFARQLAGLGDIYVNDAFSVSHRAHASVEAITRFLPSYVGRLMAAELSALSSALENPKHPILGIIAGAKISTKLSVLTNLVHKMDALFIGGGMANTFLWANGIAVGQSLVEEELAETAREIQARAHDHNCELILPIDAIVAKEITPNTPTQILDIANILEDDMILDIGPKTTAILKDTLFRSKTLLWNGPLGVFEVPPFDQGTRGVAEIAGKRSKEGSLFSIAGGGETIAALTQAGYVENFGYASTAGGAFLEWLEGKELPGVIALKRSCREGSR